MNSESKDFYPLRNPATDEIVTYVPQASQRELEEASKVAAYAFKSWKKTTVLARQRIMFELQALIRTNMDLIATSIVTEQGKTFADAKGDVMRGLQVVEQACGIPTSMMGEKLAVSHGMDTWSIREPLGVVAGIAPFNFPAMIPLWMFPLAIACGNTCLLKPSERDPGATMILARLAEEAGVPKGVLNIVHGGNYYLKEVSIPSTFCVMIQTSRQFLSLVVIVLASTFTCEDQRMEREFRLTWVPKTTESFCLTQTKTIP